MTDQTATDFETEPETHNAWVHFNDEPNGEAYAAWVELLATDRNRKGLTKISIEYHGGRAGYKEIAEVGTSDEKGKVPTANAYAQLDANTTARQAYEVASKDHRRHARVLYRMQLWHAGKRNEDDRKGEYATIRFDNGAAVDGGSIGDGSTMKVIREMLQDARKFALEMANAQIQMAQAASGTSLFGLQMVDEMARRKSELADYAAHLRMQPSAEDVNRRVESVMSRVAGPLQTLANAMAPKVQQWAGNMNPGAPGPNPGPSSASSPSSTSAGQEKAQAFFSSLSSEQCDQLRDAMGSDKFGALAEVINGGPEQWASEAAHIKPTILPHLADLKRILTPEQFATLVGI